MPVDNSEDFDTFVKRQQRPGPDEKPIDWDAERDKWLTSLRELYSKIELFLAKYIEDGEITF